MDLGSALIVCYVDRVNRLGCNVELLGNRYDPFCTVRRITGCLLYTVIKGLIAVGIGSSFGFGSRGRFGFNNVNTFDLIKPIIKSC